MSSRPVLSWVALYTAMVLDVAQVFALDFSDGFRTPVLGVLAIVAFGIEVTLFSVALRRIESSIAYGLYGLGTAAVAVISIGWLGETLTITKGVALAAVITGAVLLNIDGIRPPTPVAAEARPVLDRSVRPSEMSART